MATPMPRWKGFNVSNAKQRILGEGLWTASGQIAAAVGTLIGVRLLTEFVPPDIFGTVALLLGFSTLGYNLFCTPLLHASCRFYSEAKGDLTLLRRIVQRSLRSSTLLVVGLILLGGVVYGAVQKVSYWAVVPLAGLVVLDVLRGLEMNFLTAARRQKEYALWTAAEAWSRPLLAIAAVICFSASAGFVLLAYGLASLACLTCFLLSARREGVERDSVPKQEEPSLRRQILDYALPLIPSAVVAWLMFNSDRYLIGSTLGLEKVGIYAATCGLVSRPLLLAGGILTQTLRPVYFNAVSAQNRAQERRIFGLWLGAAALVGAGAVLGFGLCGDLIAQLLLAKQYHSGTNLLPILALGFCFLLMANTVSERFFAFKRTKALVAIQGLATVLYLGLAIPFVLNFGLKGAAIAQATYFFLYVCLLLVAGRQPWQDQTGPWHSLAVLGRILKFKKLAGSPQAPLQSAHLAQ